MLIDSEIESAESTRDAREALALEVQKGIVSVGVTADHNKNESSGKANRSLKVSYDVRGTAIGGDPAFTLEQLD